MSEQLPYEEDLIRKLQDLPLPDADAAWEDMQQRLEGDKDDRRSVVPPRFRGCGRYALLFILLLLLLVAILADPFGWRRKNTQQPAEITAGQQQSETGIDAGESTRRAATSDTLSPTIPQHSMRGKDSSATGIIAATPTDTLQRPQQAPSSRSAILQEAEHRQQIRHGRTGRKKTRGWSSVKTSGGQPATVEQSSNDARRQANRLRQTKGNLSSTASGGAVTDSSSDPVNKIVAEQELPATPRITADTLITKRSVPDTANQVNKDSSERTGSRSDASEKKMFHFGAGLGLHQLLPVDGQKSNPYNASGRKGSLGDYIPSVYIRMYKEKKWFVQAEFRYGAPQYTREIRFAEKKIFDTASNTVISNGSNVRKTFYHQLPLSFHYYVLPGLSVGAGVTFNKFTAAVVQEEVRIFNPVTQNDSLINAALSSRKKADSNFVTTYLQGLLEVQYSWKRLSLGARYSLGLQPYLKFRGPTGEQRSEKNSSLQLFFRYELWRSKKNR